MLIRVAETQTASKIVYTKKTFNAFVFNFFQKRTQKIKGKNSVK